MPAIRKNKRKRKSRYHRGDYVSLKSHQTYRYRSKWEHLYMMHLDSLTEVESWTYENVVIKYISNIRTKKIRRYHPDFYVRYSCGREEIVELKPKRKLTHLTVRKKAAAAESWCKTRGMTYKILTEVELKLFGLL